MIRLCVAALALLALAACSHKYRLDSFDQPGPRLTRGSTFLVMMPENGRYAAENYPNSGDQTARAVEAALARYAQRVERAPAVESFDAALNRARQSSITYLFEPVILHWEDRATEWSGIPDKITLKYSVYDVSTGKLMASTVTSASSKWGTLGGDHPQDLLPIPTNGFVDKLF